jgi:hypothetical protein
MRNTTEKTQAFMCGLVSKLKRHIFKNNLFFPQEYCLLQDRLYSVPRKVQSCEYNSENGPSSILLSLRHVLLRRTLFLSGHFVQI